MVSFRCSLLKKVSLSFTSNKIRNFVRSLGFILLLISTNFAQASLAVISSADEILKKQRTDYKAAITAYNKRHFKRFNYYSSKLKDYPLYPYLQYNEFKRHLSSKNFSVIKSFIEEHSDSPVSDNLQNQFLNKLAKRQQWKEFLLLYKPQSNIRYQCLYLKALYKEGFIEPAFQQVPELWAVGKSQNKNCDYIFNKFKKAGRITNTVIWKRIELAIKNGKTKLALYLSKDLNKEDQSWVKLWTRIHRSPLIAKKSRLLKKPHSKQYTIITHAINRLARKKPEKAIELLSYFTQATGIPHLNKIEAYKSIALSLVRKHSENATTWLNKIPDEYSTQRIIEWKIQNGIREESWSVVISQIEALPASQQQKIRWQFWWGYAHKQLGNEVESTEILTILASKRDYYGFLAADIINQPYKFENAPIQVTQNSIQKISNINGILRAKEFYHFNQIVKARREWNKATTDFSDQELLTAAKIAHSWGWYDRAIAAIGKTKNLNDIEVRFPLAFKDTIDNYSNKNKIDSAWTYAIIRRESIFIKDAKSEKGALGLMQLLPGTARATAKAIRTRYSGQRQLIKSKPNIRLGTYYLNKLFKKYNKQTVLATAAYNAGPGNVKRWLPEGKPMDAIRWIESIPYKETREYVINVLAYKIIYQHRMGLVDLSQLSQLMPPVPTKI